MSENEMNTTSEKAANTKNDVDSTDLLAVATRQRAMMMALLAYILVILGSMSVPAVRANEVVIMIPVILAIVFFTARLCWLMYGKVFALILTVLCCIPYVNILIMLMVSSRATKMLKDKGFKVGLLGANIKEVAAGR